MLSRWCPQSTAPLLFKFASTVSFGFLRHADTGMLKKELCSNSGFSDATFYVCRAKFDGM